MKYIILVGDGMGDLPLSDLGFKTPLETANTPTMDNLSRNSELFRLQSIPTGMQPGSDIANLSLLGYDPIHSPWLISAPAIFLALSQTF
jgi:2,3-bisphosphoglycerate-independent phosphoglycerate mutase